jgi:hypothetical protein
MGRRTAKKMKQLLEKKDNYSPGVMDVGQVVRVCCSQQEACGLLSGGGEHSPSCDCHPQ